MSLNDLSKDQLIVIITQTNDELNRIRVYTNDALDHVQMMLSTGTLTNHQIAIDCTREAKSAGLSQIHAIKAYRVKTKCGLYEAKQTIADSGLWDEVV